MQAINQYQGRVVTFGSEIYLMHVDSQMFLTSLLSPVEIDKPPNVLGVSDYFTNGMVFKILPKYKLRKEGDSI